MRILLILAGSVLVAAAYNFFLIPHEILSSGLSGIAIMLGIVTPLNTGVLNLLLNLPLLILGVMKLGKRFIAYTIVSVASLSLFLYAFPIIELSTEPILSSLFGGVLTGAGVGLTFRASASSGGFDIIAMLIARKRDFPLGTLLSFLNAGVIVTAGFLFSWDAALSTLIAIYATGKVVDAIHTKHIKLTLHIVTARGDQLCEKLLCSLYRGITVMEATGAYSGANRSVLMTVITRYQLNEVKQLIHEVDPHAFVNITQTVEVVGLFHRE